MNWHTLMSFHQKKGYERVNFLTKKMRTFFCTTITTVALRQIKARARTWISGHVFPILICFFWTPNLSPITGVISFKRCFLLKNWGPHFAKKKKSSPYNSNYFIILPNNSNRVSLKLNSSETKFVWSNLKILNKMKLVTWRQLELRHFSHQLNSKIIQRRKSLRHVATVANFLNDNKLETSLKKWIRTVSNFIDLIQFHLICQMLATFSGGESERTLSKFRERKRTFLCFALLLHKAGAWN